MKKNTNKTNKKNLGKNKKIFFFFMSVLMIFTLNYLAFSPATVVKQISMTKNLSSSYLNNQINSILAETTDTEVVRMLPYDFSAPKNPPSSSNFFKEDGKTCYKDSTIEVTCWKECTT